jgi:uncharacterized protein YndB with AHSA1/START domain
MNANSDARTKIEPVEKSIRVGLSVEAAFRLFTEGIGSWWPLSTHSVGLERAETCVLEGRPGGRLYETLADGSESLWGTVLVWEPPQRVVLTWHPGRKSGTAQELEVRFRASGSGTEVRLSHRGWETLGAQAIEVRDGYVSGWDHVLGFYLATARA